ADLAITLHEVGAVDHQSPDVGELTEGIKRGDRVARCQGDKLKPPVDKQRIGANYEGIEAILHEACKSGVDLQRGCGGEEFNLPSDDGCRGPHVIDRTGKRRWSDEDGKATSFRSQFLQEPELLASKFPAHGGRAGDVAARPINAGDKTYFDWVRAKAEDNWDYCGCRFGGECRRRAPHDDHSYTSAYKFGGEFRQTVGLVVGRAVFDRQVLALDKA